jgi:hypothetical protein
MVVVAGEEVIIVYFIMNSLSSRKNSIIEMPMSKTNKKDINKFFVANDRISIQLPLCHSLHRFVILFTKSGA